MTRRPGRPAGGKRVVDRTEILDSAERVIRRDGANATIEAIAVEAGVTKPTIYAWAGDRTTLADALGERLVELLADRNREAITRSGGGRPGLVAFIETTLDTMAEQRDLFLFVTNAPADDTARQRLRLTMRASEPLADEYARQRTAQGLDPAVSVAWANAVTGMLNTISLWWISESDESASTIAEQLADLLWPGLSGTSDAAMDSLR